MSSGGANDLGRHEHDLSATSASTSSIGAEAMTRAARASVIECATANEVTVSISDLGVRIKSSSAKTNRRWNIGGYRKGMLAIRGALEPPPLPDAVRGRTMVLHRSTYVEAASSVPAISLHSPLALFSGKPTLCPLEGIVLPEPLRSQAGCWYRCSKQRPCICWIWPGNEPRGVDREIIKQSLRSVQPADAKQSLDSAVIGC